MALGLLVAVASWSLAFTPPAPGIDQGWVAGLFMAAHRGFEFGSQIVFSWGPLAFLRLPFLYYGDLAVLGFVYSALLYSAVAMSLVWALRRSFNAAVAVVLTFLVLGALPTVNLPLTLAAVWCLAVLTPQPSPATKRIVVFGGAVFGATECLVRLSPGPAILLIAAVALLPSRSRWRDLAAFAATALAAFAVLWFASGQSFGNVPAYLQGSLQTVSGYGQAMVVVGAPSWWIPAAILVSLVLVGTAAIGAGGGWNRVAAAAVMGIASFVVFKEDVVRLEAGHAAILFSTLAALALAVRWRRPAWPLAAGCFALVFWLALEVVPSVPAQRLEPWEHAELFASQVDTLVDPGRRDELTEDGRAEMRAGYRLDPRTLSLLRGQPVEIEPWEAGVAWAYGLDWRPLPVFQDYAAYTSYLDRRNTDALLAPGGPRRVLRENMAEPDTSHPYLSIDARFSSWDPPAQAMALLCNFAPLRTTRRWQVLARLRNRCGEPRLLRSVKTDYDRTVAVPRVSDDQVVFARIHGAGVSGFESIRTLLFRARARYLVTNGGAAYRLVPGTAADGLIMRVPRRDDFPGPAFRLSPDAETVSPQGASGPLTIDFYTMPIRP